MLTTARQRPKVLSPMLATLADAPPADDENYGVEFKWDGYRALAFWDGRSLEFASRNGNSLSSQFPELQALKAALGQTPAILDGEIVATDRSGRIDFHALQMRMGIEKRAPGYTTRQASYFIFDVLMWEGISRLEMSYYERRHLLGNVLSDAERWKVPLFSPGNAQAMLSVARQSALEGIVAKKLTSRYIPGARSRDWLKIKLTLSEEFIIGGWLPGDGAFKGSMGSLLLGYYTSAAAARGGELTFAGGVGTGFSRTDRDAMFKRLETLKVERSPFANFPRDYKYRPAQFVAPVMVCEVVFTEWTPFGILRHPSFKGLRTDKEPAEIIMPTSLSK